VILESIVTTADADGVVNVAPMGPHIDNESFTGITLKPFRSSRTYANLKRSGVAVVHVTDDVEMIAQAAIGTVTAEGVTMSLLGRWHKLIDCCSARYQDGGPRRTSGLGVAGVFCQ
jgi:hypothetical protein